MAGLIIGIIVLLVCIVGCIYLCVEDYKTAGVCSLLVGVVLCVGLIFAGCCTSIPTGHIGVITVFGRVEDKTLESGFHTKSPWETVVKMDNRVQTANVELACFSSDIQEVNCKYTVNYQIDKANAQELYKTIGKNYYDTAISPTVAESVKTIMAKYSAEELIGKRDSLSKEIEIMLRDELRRYNINVVSTAIENLDFTDSFTNAVEAKQVAAQNKLKAEIEQAQAIKRAEADAEVAKTKADADARVAKVNAEAAAEVAKIQAIADKEVAQIGADSAEYQGKKDAAIIMQKIASINGWNVKTDAEGNSYFVKASNDERVTNDELEVGVKNLLQYYYYEAWNGEFPSTYVGTNDVSVLVKGE